ncbi:OadG family protein [Billgrantia endophytica]|uniref:Probable oxaloacetate decarboxylase gamma chain n=1 Tax=Billgrantia endophytica TaxID=2033802 RepID=A0A2N7U6S5_9GAMM|nr:OadG family protein [Halomonas endophytica]PMR76125.1 sodium pump decarboxylase subunit gamma [Halomonas endophytica]
MQDMQLLLDGLVLMGLGMGFVFVFLTALVFATTLMSRVVCRLTPTLAVQSDAASVSDNADDAERMAVISAAVHRYRRRHRR